MVCDLSSPSAADSETIFQGQGLKATIESIDNRSDFKIYMQNYAYARGNVPTRGPRRDGPADEGFVSLFYFIIQAIP